MPRVYLQEMVDDIRFDGLPVNWNAFDIGAFSRTKTLWDYQRKAVENSIKALWKYYEDFGDYLPAATAAQAGQADESADANRERKEKLFQWCRDNGLDEDLDIRLAEAHKLAGLLSAYYTVEHEKISYDQFINRACFWMATGSGKTLVLVKLIEVLRGLIQRGEIPPHDILILSCRDDLIEQLKKHVLEFNAARSDLFIHLRELREYADAKRDNPVLFKDRELTVFYYRSDNLSDEQKEKIVDFRNYDDDGKWYALLIPVYKLAEKPMIEHGDGAHFEVEAGELDLLKEYVKYVGDDRVLMALYDAEPQKVGLLQASVTDTDRFYKPFDRPYRNIDLLVRRIFDYFSIVPQEFERLKQLEEQINHFKNITVSLKDISDLTEKVDAVRHYTDPAKMEKQLDDKLGKKEITLQEYKEGIKQAARMVKESKAEYQGKRLRISHVANHYYVPMILSGETDRIDYIKHIIQTASEIKFVNRLEEYLGRAGNKFQDFDWWMFRKLDESLDEVYVPYYDGTSNKVREFKPDFIFWMQKADDYSIVFIDPKGTEHTDYQRKIDGYSLLFEDSGRGKKTIPHNGQMVKVFTFLYTDDVDGLPKGYKRYWSDDIGKALNSVLSEK